MIPTPPTILAFDTSCDDTSVAVVRGFQVISSEVASQTALHAPYGGVFPTVAKHEHQKQLPLVTQRALDTAGISLTEVNFLAVTKGPGLAPALECGIQFVSQFGKEHAIPVIPVNHLEGHVLSPWVEIGATKSSPPLFPALSLVISGGHTDVFLVEKMGNYQQIAQTVDDAAGEALDKVGRLLGLGYPAGAAMEQLARAGDATTFSFPLPKTAPNDLDFSFAGLKTAARRTIERQPQPLSDTLKNDFAASFQAAVIRHVIHKLKRILGVHPSVKSLWLGGGVAANQSLRDALQLLCQENKLSFAVPPERWLCADNAAMIGAAASLHLDRANEQLDRSPQWKLQ